MLELVYIVSLMFQSVYDSIDPSVVKYQRLRDKTAEELTLHKVRIFHILFSQLPGYGVVIATEFQQTRFNIQQFFPLRFALAFGFALAIRTGVATGTRLFPVIIFAHIIMAKEC